LISGFRFAEVSNYHSSGGLSGAFHCKPAKLTRHLPFYFGDGGSESICDWPISRFLKFGLHQSWGWRCFLEVEHVCHSKLLRRALATNGLL
jgi:hypothetical protein